jgi:hypothetical protein
MKGLSQERCKSRTREVYELLQQAFCDVRITFDDNPFSYRQAFVEQMCHCFEIKPFWKTANLIINKPF